MQRLHHGVDRHLNMVSWPSKEKGSVFLEVIREKNKHDRSLKVLNLSFTCSSLLIQNAIVFPTVPAEKLDHHSVSGCAAD